MIKYLIEKEFKQLFRNSFLPKLIFIFPCMIMILMPWAANLEIKNINLNIVDNDHSVISRRLVDKIGASTYFRTTDVPGTYDEAMRAIEVGSADIILEIPRNFEKDWMQGNTPDLLVATNAVNGTKGGLGSSYLSAIINDYAVSYTHLDVYKRQDESIARGAVADEHLAVKVHIESMITPNLSPNNNKNIYHYEAIKAISPLVYLRCMQ